MSGIFWAVSWVCPIPNRIKVTFFPILKKSQSSKNIFFKIVIFIPLPNTQATDDLLLHLISPSIFWLQKYVQ